MQLSAPKVSKLHCQTGQKFEVKQALSKELS